MGEMELSCRAYVKMYLHCCLFPRCSINGLLLSSGPADGAVYVTDCVPLLHSHLPLAPITQLALTQVRPLPPQPGVSLKLSQTLSKEYGSDSDLNRMLTLL